MLYILLLLVVLITLLLLSRIRLFVEYHDKSRIYLKLSFIKIHIYPDEELKKNKRKKEKLKKVITKNKKPVTEKEKSQETDKKEASALETFSPLAKLLYVISKHFPRLLKLRISKLQISVGGKDAAAAAVNYGRVCAVADGIHAFADEFLNLSCNNKKIAINVDYISDEIKFEYKISASIFVFQALYVLFKVGME